LTPNSLGVLIEEPSDSHDHRKLSRPDPADTIRNRPARRMEAQGCARFRSRRRCRDDRLDRLLDLPRRTSDRLLVLIKEYPAGRAAGTALAAEFGEAGACCAVVGLDGLPLNDFENSVRDFSYPPARRHPPVQQLNRVDPANLGTLKSAPEAAPTITRNGTAVANPRTGWRGLLLPSRSLPTAAGARWKSSALAIEL
jgi:hypothetical protein